METNKNNYILIALLIFFILLSLALGGYIFYNKFYQKENNNPTELQPENKEEIKKDDDTIKKLDSNKELVYTIKDFEYVKMPFINIDSTYVSLVNEEIKKLYDEAVNNTTNTYGESTNLIYMDYEKYSNDDLLSINLKYGYGANSPTVYNNYTYNIDLKTGNKLSFEELYKKIGFTKDNIEEKIHNAITNKIETTIDSYNNYSYPDNKNLETTTAENYEEFDRLLSNNYLNYYIDKNGKLNIIMALIIPGVEEENTTIEIN